MKLRTFVYAAVFAALCCVATLAIAIPLPFGYVNAGDVFVLLAGFCLGPLYGGIAAGLGSALSDIFLGYAIYAPATAVIKCGVAMVAALLYRALSGFSFAQRIKILLRALSCLIGELVMVLGYFLYECLMYGLPGALTTLSGNSLQGVFGTVAGLALVTALAAIKPIRNQFPALKP